MPPYKVDGPHVIFCYSSDLQMPAETLGEMLRGHGRDVYNIRIHLAKNGFSEKGYTGTLPENAKVAWLVGHGRVEDRRIGTATFGNSVDVNEIFKWLAASRYTVVVDTCCYPDQRVAAITNVDYQFRYYCKKSNEVVWQIQQYEDFVSWWNANEIEER